MIPSEFSERSRELIHPYVEEDLKLANQVSLDKWLNAVLGFPSNRFKSWTTKIGEMKWFEDDVVQRCLREYCAAAKEVHRYSPFAELGNRILELARGKLPGVPKTKSYPVDDFCFLNSADRAIATIPEHGALGAVRRPDILNVRSSVSRRFATGECVQWTDVLLWWELKKRFNLTTILDKERVSRGLDSPDDEAPDEGAAKPVPRRKLGRKKKSAPAFKQGPKARQRPSPSSTPTVTSTAGVKRRAEDNLLDGLTLRSSNKTRQTADPQFGLYLGKEAAVQSGSCTQGRQPFPMSCAAIIVAMARCKAEQFGVLPATVIKPPTPYPKSFPPSNLGDSGLTIRHPITNKRILITLKRPLFSQYVLLGRRTFVYTIETSPATPATGLIAKFAYQVHSRKTEHELVKKAHDAGVQHLPEIHMWADLWKLSDAARRIFHEGEKKPKYEDRIFRMIVYTQFASIKSLFSERCELIPIMVEQMLDCLHDLRYKANILHRDISVNNVMYEKRGSRYFFVLIDFDMGVILPRNPESNYYASSKHRTGTLPFMASELVRDACRSDKPNWKPIRHVLRHDFESLFWLSLWCVLTLLTHTVDSKTKDSLLGWAKSLETGPIKAIAANKESITNLGLGYLTIDLPDPAQCLKRWFRGWTRLMRTANSAAADRFAQLENLEDSRAENVDVPDPEHFDEETAGGTFTKDIINEVLSPLMPLKPTDICIQDLEEQLIQDDGEDARVFAAVPPAPELKRRKWR
ncbi:hypothetical protein NM688_g1117 [Phlebia brevispora]|uniref:Uncharacterized protein n=1 Tax=Phlebia brevispora TaxID=194682 RepID=A0ACC1TCR6_9APHY|nr:hypothetical protein NM688_g1117 [Phlebia brevispora]